MNTAPTQILLPIPEACHLLGIGRSKLYALIAEGLLPVRKIGRKTLIARADILSFIDRLPLIQRDAQ